MLYKEYLRGLDSRCLDSPASGSSVSAGGVAMGGFSYSEDSSVSCILSPKGVLGWYLELMLETGLGSPGAREAGG